MVTHPRPRNPFPKGLEKGIDQELGKLKAKKQLISLTYNLPKRGGKAERGLKFFLLL
jgi:hypothetical protein